MNGEQRYYVTPRDGQPYRVRLRPRGGAWEATVERDEESWTFPLAAGPGSGEAWCGDRPIRYRWDSAGRLTLDGWGHELRVESEIRHRVAELGLGAEATGRAARVTAPMPGLVLVVEVAEGEVVHEGQGLVIIEAMKMENEIRAPIGGTVRDLAVAVGDAIERDAPLCTVDPGEDE